MDGPFIFYATSDAKGTISNGDFYTDEHDIGVTFQLDREGRDLRPDCAGDLHRRRRHPEPVRQRFTPSLNTDGCDSNANQWVNGNLSAGKSHYTKATRFLIDSRFDRPGNRRPAHGHHRVGHDQDRASTPSITSRRSTEL